MRWWRRPGKQNVRFIYLGKYQRNSFLYCNFPSNGKCLLTPLESEREELIFRPDDYELVAQSSNIQFLN